MMMTRERRAACGMTGTRAILAQIFPGPPADGLICVNGAHGARRHDRRGLEGGAGLQRVLLGSVTDTVLAQSRVPVLVYR